jgi:hypothetical protein
MMKANRATVTIAGLADGMQILSRTCQDEAPSVTAASSSSRGMALRLLRMM